MSGRKWEGGYGLHPSDATRRQSSPRSTPRTPPRSKRPPPSPSLLYALRSSTPFAPLRPSRPQGPLQISSRLHRPHRQLIALIAGRSPSAALAFAPLRPHASPLSRLKELVLPFPFAPFAPLRLIAHNIAHSTAVTPPSTAPFDGLLLSRLLAACAHLVRCAPCGLGRRVEAHGGEAAAKAAQRRANARCTPIAHLATLRCGGRSL